ncbi:MAG: hypothetical protein NkDv07_0489 [Candidatus Improbicoccus devescovinae]|nr:MAG: hypothetical protein NkDv07_0489 [Candidatus Improbicoccus devescovinae]
MNGFFNNLKTKLTKFIDTKGKPANTLTLKIATKLTDDGVEIIKEFEAANTWPKLRLAGKKTIKDSKNKIAYKPLRQLIGLAHHLFGGQKLDDESEKIIKLWTNSTAANQFIAAEIAWYILQFATDTPINKLKARINKRNNKPKSKLGKKALNLFYHAPKGKESIKQKHSDFKLYLTFPEITLKKDEKSPDPISLKRTKNLALYNKIMEITPTSVIARIGKNPQGLEIKAKTTDKDGNETFETITRDSNFNKNLKQYIHNKELHVQMHIPDIKPTEVNAPEKQTEDTQKGRSSILPANAKAKDPQDEKEIINQKQGKATEENQLKQGDMQIPEIKHKEVNAPEKQPADKQKERSSTLPAPAKAQDHQDEKAIINQKQGNAKEVQRRGTTIPAPKHTAVSRIIHVKLPDGEIEKIKWNTDPTDENAEAKSKWSNLQGNWGGWSSYYVGSDKQKIENPNDVMNTTNNAKVNITLVMNRSFTVYDLLGNSDEFVVNLPLDTISDIYKKIQEHKFLNNKKKFNNSHFIFDVLEQSQKGTTYSKLATYIPNQCAEKYRILQQENKENRATRLLTLREYLPLKLIYKIPSTKKDQVYHGLYYYNMQDSDILKFIQVSHNNEGKPKVEIKIDGEKISEDPISFSNKSYDLCDSLKEHIKKGNKPKTITFIPIKPTN